MDERELIIKALAERRGTLSAMLKLLKSVCIGEEIPPDTVVKQSRVIKKLEGLITQLKGVPDVLTKLSTFLEQREAELRRATERNRRRFGAQLEEDLKRLGLSLAGQGTELKCGLFTVELHFESGRARLWYGPKQEPLRDCLLRPADIAKGIKQARDKLGSKLNQQAFVDRLFRAYKRTSDGKVGPPAPIVRVLAEMAPLVQSARFQADPRIENYKSYGRADFSYDLFRFRVSATEKPMLLPSGPRLVVATRAHTKRRDNFLWVPNDEKSGSGTTYSHLQFNEGSQ